MAQITRIQVLKLANDLAAALPPAWRPCGSLLAAHLPEAPGRTLVFAPGAAAPAGIDRAGDPVADLSADPVDTMLGVDVAGRVNLLDFFWTAFEGLAVDGRLLLLDTLGTQRDEAAPAPPLVEHVIAQAQRCGFELALRHDLPLPAPVGCGALLLAFRRGAPPQWRLRPLADDDRPAVQDLFQHAFRHSLSDAMWQWKYGDGRGCGITAWAGGRLIGHLGVVARDVVCRGQTIPSGQYGDAMIHADYRGSGVYRDLVATASEQFMGYGTPHPLTIAFPFERQVRLLERWRLQARVNQMQQIEWPAFGDGRDWRLTTRRLALPGDTAAAEGLWAQMKQDFAGEILGVRDAGWLSYRYLQHPEIHYDLYLVSQRLTRRPLGILVLKPESERVVLVDIVGARRHMPALVQGARRLAATMGRPALHCWIDAGHAATFAGLGGRTQPLDMLVTANTWSPGPPAGSLAGAWWLTMGDTDYL